MTKFWIETTTLYFLRSTRNGSLVRWDADVCLDRLFYTFTINSFRITICLRILLQLYWLPHPFLISLILLSWSSLVLWNMTYKSMERLAVFKISWEKSLSTATFSMMWNFWLHLKGTMVSVSYSFCQQYQNSRRFQTLYIHTAVSFYESINPSSVSFNRLLK